MSTRSLALSGPIELIARIGDGSFTVTTSDDVTRAEVTITPRGGSDGAVENCVVELRGPNLIVAAPRHSRTELGIPRRRKRDALDFTVVVPHGTQIRMRAYTAAITLDGRFGSAHISAGSSDITIGTVDGDLTVHLGTGDARVRQVTGKVDVRSGSGNLAVERSDGPLRSRAGSGTAIIGAAYGDVDLASGSGAITIGVPAGVTAKLDVLTGSGDASSELPVDGSPTARRTQISLRARTGTGPVRIVRAA